VTAESFAEQLSKKLGLVDGLMPEDAEEER
jgi:hypothetical protein